MSEDYRELLTAPARSRMLPDLILARLGELEDGYPDIARAPDPEGTVAGVRAGLAACLGLAAIPLAGALVSIAPIVLLYLSGQRFFVRGLTAGIGK